MAATANTSISPTRRRAGSRSGQSLERVTHGPLADVTPNRKAHMPISRKVIAGALAAGVGALLPLLGIYHVSAEAQSIISAAEAFAAGWLFKEEAKLV